MKNLNKKLGVGGECSCIADALHPSALIREKYGTNGYKERRINHLLVIRLEDRIIRRRNVLSLVLRHDDFPNIELYAAAAKVNIFIYIYINYICAMFFYKYEIQDTKFKITFLKFIFIL